MDRNNIYNDIDEVGLAGDVAINFDSMRRLRLKAQDNRFEKLPVAVRIYKVVTPSRFYFHLEETYRQLVGLEREMADYYDENPEIKFPKKNEKPVLPFEFYGWYSKSKKRWVRALKDGFHDYKNGFTVVLVDYVEREFVANEKELRYLPDQFCDLQAQGFQAQLYLEDGETNKVWSESESCSFREKVLHQPLSITPVGFNTDHPFMPEFCVFIHVDTPNGNSLYLGGVYPYGTETLPEQKALIEVTRVRNNIWSKRIR